MDLFTKKQFWDLVLGVGWSDLLYDDIIINRPVIEGLRVINDHFEDKSLTVYPKRSRIFKAFKECPSDKVKLVMVGPLPYSNKNATGLAFANPKGTPEHQYSNALQNIRDSLERAYPGYGEKLDPSLIHWANQGVLLLNYSLTTTFPYNYNPGLLWRTFMQLVIRRVTMQGGIAVVLIGESAKSLESCVEPFNTLYKLRNPDVVTMASDTWDIDFKHINSFLCHLYNKGIEWVKDP